MVKQTPIEKILLPARGLRSRALTFLQLARNRTAEELIERYDTISLPNIYNIGPKTAGYIIDCLAKNGFELREGTPTPKEAIERYGIEKAQRVVLSALEGLSSRYPYVFFSPKKIGEEAEDYASKSLPQIDFRELQRIFKHQNVNAMLIKGGALENFLESVDVFVGGRDITIDKSKTARVYRLKQTKQRGAK